MKVRDVIKLVEGDGWYYVGTTGSHRHYKHPDKKGKVTISGHPGEDIPLPTYRSVLKQAQISTRRKWCDILLSLPKKKTMAHIPLMCLDV